MQLCCEDLKLELKQNILCCQNCHDDFDNHDFDRLKVEFKNKDYQVCCLLSNIIRHYGKS